MQSETEYPVNIDLPPCQEHAPPYPEGIASNEAPFFPWRTSSSCDQSWEWGAFCPTGIQITLHRSRYRNIVPQWSALL